MLVAVSALLQTPGNVSSKWSKPQLAEVLMRWTKEAISLSHPSQQSKLFVELKSFKRKRKTWTYPLQSLLRMMTVPSPPSQFPPRPRPSEFPRLSTSHRQRRDDFDLVDGLSTISRTPQTPNSISTSASSFARRLEQVSSFAALAATSDADPGVRASDEETAHLANHALAKVGVMFIPPRPVCAYKRSMMFSILTNAALKQVLAPLPSPKDSRIEATMNAWRISSASTILELTSLTKRIFLAPCQGKRLHLQRKTSWQFSPFFAYARVSEFVIISTLSLSGPLSYTYLSRPHSREL